MKSGASSGSRGGPSEEQVAARAYELFLMRGASHGCDVEDWLQAERELGENN
jgi:Protein of unknown function (DUF2934)